MVGDLPPEIQRYLEVREERANRLLSSKPSPKAFGMGSEVVVTYPPSKFFRKVGTVVDLNYLERSARKGYGDYTVTVEFPGGHRRKFLMGRVRATSILSKPGIEERLESVAAQYNRAKRRRKLLRNLRRKYGNDDDAVFSSPEYMDYMRGDG